MYLEEGAMLDPGASQILRTMTSGDLSYSKVAKAPRDLDFPEEIVSGTRAPKGAWIPRVSAKCLLSWKS